MREDGSQEREVDLRSLPEEIQREIEPHGKLNFGTPATPRPSASIILLRRGDKQAGRSLEILLVKRTNRARFMPGFWVFPGGAVDPGDGEAGDTTAHHRCAMRELEEEAGIALADDTELVPYTRWITPEWSPTRFDARFFFALAPRHARAVPDGEETIGADWFEPGEALAAHAGGEMMLAFPTIRQLEDLARYRTVDEILARFRGRTEEPIIPIVVETAAGPRLTLPGEEDYPG